MPNLKPILSLLFIVGSLLFVVFAKMEERRIGYEILKLNRDHKNLTEEWRHKDLILARISRPQHVEKFAQDKLTLHKLQDSQIIQLSSSAVIPLRSSESKKGL